VSNGTRNYPIPHKPETANFVFTIPDISKSYKEGVVDTHIFFDTAIFKVKLNTSEGKYHTFNV
jgi:hypothetical protein